MSVLSYFSFDGDQKAPQFSLNAQGQPTARTPDQPTPTSNELDSMNIGIGATYTGPIYKPESVHRHEILNEFREPERRCTEIDMQEQYEMTGPNDIEASRPSTPDIAGSIGIAQTFFYPAMNKWRVLAVCLILFCNGASDSALGALLPYIETHYRVGYAIASLIFVATAIGFISAAFFVQAIDQKLGRAGLLMLCEALNILAYVAMTVAPPFAVFVIAFALNGFAMATALALNNLFVANLAGATGILGVAQGSYGLGGIIGPLVSSTMATHGILFSRFYAILIGVRIITLVSSGWTFRHLERDSPNSTDLLTPLERIASHHQQQRETGASQPVKTSSLKELFAAMTNRVTIIGALFIFAYQGAEVAISGWVISFLLNYRDNSPEKVGYVTTYFWAGITVGRFVLSPVAAKVGFKLFVWVLTVAAIAFQLIVWFVPNIIGDFVAIALVGLVLGPVYPAAFTIFARLLPRRIQSTAVAFIGSAGSSGGAIAPFMTGLLSQVSGTWVLHPVAIGLFVVMGVCWACLPSVEKRKE